MMSSRKIAITLMLFVGTLCLVGQAAGATFNIKVTNQDIGKSIQVSVYFSDVNGTKSSLQEKLTVKPGVTNSLKATLSTCSLTRYRKIVIEVIDTSNTTIADGVILMQTLSGCRYYNVDYIDFRDYSGDGFNVTNTISLSNFNITVKKG